MMHAEAAIVTSTRAGRSRTLRGRMTTPAARWAGRVCGLSAVGILAVGVYSKAMPPTVGVDETLLALVIFTAAAVSSVGGFAFSALCGAALFHTQMDRVEIVQTMLISSIGIQVLMILSMWRAIEWLRLCRFLIGGVIGVPVGLFVLLHVERRPFAIGVGALLCIYSAYMILRRPFVLPRRTGMLDVLVGFAGGVTGGAVAFPGAPVTAWCQLKGLTRDQQRGIYQPFILLMQIASLTLMALLSPTTDRAGPALNQVMSVPPALAGALIGLYIYHRCTDRIFLIVVNGMLFLSGVTLLV